VFILIGAISSCKKMDYFQSNPNAPSAPVPSSMLTSLESDLFNISPTASSGANEDPNYGFGTAMQYFVGFSYHSQISQSYQWVTTSMNEYLRITDATTMSSAPAANAAYRAIGKLITAIYFYSLTNKFGDVPCTQTVQLLNGVKQPAYDAQKKVYQVILANLDTANNLLSTTPGSSSVISGDFIYANNLSKWRRFVNSFRLRVIMSLSNKTSDPDLNPKVLFADMMNNPLKYPMFESNADNAQQMTNTVTPTPFFNNPAYVYYGMAKDFTDTLIQYRDPRLMQWADITAAAKAAGKSIFDYSAYSGLPSDSSGAYNTARASQASIVNIKYFQRADYETNLYLGFHEVNFAIGEGIARSWWGSLADAETYYKRGITASMARYNIPTDTINRYLAGPRVQFNPNRALQQILFQRYIAGVNNSYFEPFYTQRRTGIPVMAVKGSGVPSGKQALRWQYPVSEYTLNEKNVKAAVSSQYSGGDIVTERMWVIKP
jgi:hypothetical protein